MNQNYFVKVSNPENTRKELLEIAKRCILLIKEKEKTQKIRNEKKILLQSIEEDLQDIQEYWDKLDAHLPEYEGDVDSIDTSIELEKDLEALESFEEETDLDDSSGEEEITEEDIEERIEESTDEDESIDIDSDVESEVERLEYTLNKIEDTIDDLDN